MARHHALEQTPDGATCAGIDEGDTQVQTKRSGIVIERQFNIIHADNLAPVYVDNLLVEEVALEQQHAFAAGVLGKIGEVCRSMHAAVDPAQEITGDDTVSAGGAYDEGRDADGIVLGKQRNFAHASHLPGIRVIDGET